MQSFLPFQAQTQVRGFRKTCEYVEEQFYASSRDETNDYIISVQRVFTSRRVDARRCCCARQILAGRLFANKLLAIRNLFELDGATGGNYD